MVIEISQNEFCEVFFYDYGHEYISCSRFYYYQLKLLLFTDDLKAVPYLFSILSVL